MGDVGASAGYDVKYGTNMLGIPGASGEIVDLRIKAGAPGIKMDSKLDFRNYMLTIDAGGQEDWGKAQGVFFGSLLGGGITINLELTMELDVKLNFVENIYEYE